MNTTGIGVWILELVTAPDRASSIIGDFVEESEMHGRFWFWRQIVLTFLAQVGREFMTAGLGLIVKCILLSFAYLFVATIVGMLIADPIWYGAANEQTLPSGMRFIPALPIWLGMLCSAPLYVRSGWLLAEKTSRPIMATSIFAILCFFIARNPNDAAHPYAPLISLLVLMGAIWQRRRSLNTT